MNKEGHAPAGDGCYDMCGKYHRWRLTTKDPLTGENRVKTIKAKSMAKLHERVTAWKTENLGDGAAPYGARNVKVADWVETWLNSLEGKLADRSVYYYRVLSDKYIVAKFGKKLIGNVSQLELQLYFDSLAKTLAPASLSTVRYLFSSCFAKATRLGVIPRNPVRFTDTPQLNKPDLKILDEKDVEAILRVAKDGTYNAQLHGEAKKFMMLRNYLVLLLAVASGMRQGEILGLTWNCVDFDQAKLEVRHSLQFLPNNRKLKAPKNGKPRIVAIPHSVADELRKWKEAQAAFAEKFRGIYVNDMDLVFTNHKGNFVNGSYFSAWIFHEICKAAGVEGARFHDLRHFWASSALSKGVNIVAVSSQLGHSSTNITFQKYTHVLERSRDELREMLDDNPLFSGGDAEKKGAC